MSRTVRAQIRAAVLAVVIAAHAILAAPLPQVVTPHMLRDDANREEFERWMEWLHRLGDPISEATARQLLFDITGVIGRAHASVRRPIQTVIGWSHTGTGQGWALFVNPDTWPNRLEIDGRVGDTWEALYRRFDPQRDLLDGQLTYRRVRAVYDNPTTTPRPSARELARWIAGRVLLARTDVEQVKVRVVRCHTPIPGGRDDRTCKNRYELAFDRTTAGSR